MIAIELSDRVDLSRLAEAWRDLENRAEASFFQSWWWVGCLVEERFPDPVLLQAREAGVTIALGLFNRRHRFGQTVLLLNASGIPRHDAVFIEHNGFLVERGRPAELIADCLRASTARRRRVVLNGVPELYAALTGRRRRGNLTARAAPYIDLAAVRKTKRAYLDHLSANTRYQLRRSRRRFADSGPLALRRAETAAEALRFLDRLAELHQDYWTRRGQPGAFANPDFLRFHRALIARAFPGDVIDLLRLSAGDRAIGYLYNFRYCRSVYAYQSGFDYVAADNARKPGLTSHHLAIERYLAAGEARYDFLAGGDRYKFSLSTGAATLHWFEIGGGPVAALCDLLGAIGTGWLRGGRDLSASRSGQIG